MKVMSTMSPPPIARDPVKSAAARSVSSTADGAGASVGKAAEKTVEKANSADRVPPGLERVQARLESIPAESRTAGQARALENIGLNIARYRERHGVTEPTPPATQPTPPVTEPTPPAAEPTPPVTDATPPATEPTPPAADATPPAAETPVAAAPTLDGTTVTPPVAAEPSDVVETPLATPPLPAEMPAVASMDAALVEALPPSGSLVDVEA